MTESRKKKFLHRGLLVAGLGVLVVGMMLSPAIGGSFLSKKKANKTFVTKKNANKQFLGSAQAVKTATAFSTTLPGFQSTATTDTDIPGATASVTAPGDATLVVTFNAVSLCTNGTAGFRCAVKVLVDGQPANPIPDATGYDFDTTVVAANSKNRALSLTVDKPVTAGPHTVKVVSTGLQAGSTFTMRVWHLLVQSYPR